MPQKSVKLIPGVNQNDTPVLNEAGIAVSQLIRFTYDKTLGGVAQKLGGWSRFFGSQMAAIPRALWGWEDTNAEQHLAIGTQNVGATGQSLLSVITDGSLVTITPRSSSENIAPVISTTSGSATVTITDTATTGITSYDTVYFRTQVSVGGLILFGLYACETLSSTTYQIVAIDEFGNPLAATSTSTSPTLPTFTTASGSSVVTVVLTNHGYSVGNTFPVLVSTAVGGVTIYGNYLIQSVVDANTFTISGTTQATSTATATINAGDLALTYSYGVGAIPPGSGYGIGGYGRGGYGSGSGIAPTSGTPISATDWTLDNWGQVLIACPINGTQFQPIYQYDPTSGSPTATILSYGPPVSDGMFVAMPQRQIIAWGSSFTGIQDPLLIRWCDVSNLNVWIAQATNQAGSYRLPRGSRIVGGIQGPQQALLWTDLAVWAMQYIGGELVYGFDQISDGCGLIARKAAAATQGGNVYWMGPSQFFQMVGGSVSVLPCDVWDVIFQNLDETNLSKIRVAVNSRFNEIAWYFPTLTSGGEVAMYVKYNTLLEVWDYGPLARSAWIDQSVLGPPIGADPNLLYLYQHETSPDADDQPMISGFITGYAALNDGDEKVFVDWWWPDMKWGQSGGSQNATVSLQFYVTDYPNQAPEIYGPYYLNAGSQFVSPRFRGRLVSIQIGSGDIGSFWRMGNNRYRGAPDGKI